MNKQTTPTKKPKKESALVKIAGLVGEMAGKIANQKDHLVEMAGNAIDSVKQVAHDITVKKQPAVREVAEKTVKKLATKSVRPSVKKSPPKKAAASKKAAPPKKVAPAKKSVPVKKSTPAKNAIALKKAVNKSVAKKKIETKVTKKSR